MTDECSLPPPLTLPATIRIRALPKPIRLEHVPQELRRELHRSHSPQMKPQPEDMVRSDAADVGLEEADFMSSACASFAAHLAQKHR